MLGFQTLTLVEIQCCNCLTQFAMEDRIKTARLKDGKEFYCPLGHPQVYTDTELSRARAEAERLRRENQNLASQKQWAEELAERTKKEKTALKGQLTKTRKRVANGVCPCCHRTFKQLAAHMDSKHPDFKEVVA
jgi:hypothetical protein